MVRSQLAITVETNAVGVLLHCTVYLRLIYIYNVLTSRCVNRALCICIVYFTCIPAFELAFALLF